VFCQPPQLHPPQPSPDPSFRVKRGIQPMPEHRIHPVVGARFIWHNVLPTTQTPPTTTQTLSLEEHRIHPVVGARFIWHNVLLTTQLRPPPPKPAPKRHFE
ncbi:MAG: hypothetical protein RBT36_08085, partial [Desulfobulbus sp.]|nr:hypothetical protein [Desulfobulbus sp.]